ncbi:MAG TPA: cytochrome P450 [Pseudonocardiaceae bacterium]
MLPEIDPTDPEVLRDPFTAHNAAREASPVARLLVPGFPMWMATRLAEGRTVLSDPRFAPSAGSFQGIPGVPDEYRPYLRTMAEMSGDEHRRIRRLAGPAFTARRAADFRPRIERIVDALLDAAPDDLLTGFALPLPMEVICELVGIPVADRPRWRLHGAAVAAGDILAFAEAVPELVEGARRAVAARRAEPADDLLTDLISATAEGIEPLSDDEVVTTVWHLVLAGQVPTHLVANGLFELHRHPGQLAILRARPELMPGAVEELTRWCGPQLLSVPRFTQEDVELGGVPIPAGQPVTVSIAGANRDPRAFADPDRLDVTRTDAGGHLGYAHGPHFCLGAALSRVEVAAALTGVLNRAPDLPFAEEPRYLPDGGTLRLASLRVAAA